MAILTDYIFTTKFWMWLIQSVFKFISNYGLRVVLFTVILKLILSPLDFYQRKRTRDNNTIMEAMKPEMDRIEKQYAGNQQELWVRKRAVQKKYGYGMGMTCLTAILTMVIFITLFSGFNAISIEMNKETYNGLKAVYAQTEQDLSTDYATVTAANEEYYESRLEELARNFKSQKDHKKKSDEELRALAVDAFSEAEREVYGYNFDINAVFYEGMVANSDETKQFSRIKQYLAQAAVLELYNTQYKESFLWIKNIWRADTWTNPIPTADQFAKLVKIDSFDSGEYNKVMKLVADNSYKVWNGYLILVVLSVALNFLNQFLMQKLQKQTQQMQQMPGMGNSMKMMMFIMPVMIGFFAFQYSSAFTLYMVTNALMTLIITLASTLILKLMPPKEVKIREVAKRPARPGFRR